MANTLPPDVAAWFRNAVGPEWTIRQIATLVASSATVLSIELDRDSSAGTNRGPKECPDRERDRGS